MGLKDKATALTTSMYLGFAGGVITPVMETVRRWHQIPDPANFFLWFDDYVGGAFMLFACWKTYRSRANGQHYLIGAWGFVTGMMLLSFFGQLQRLHDIDPAPIPSTAVAGIKGLMLLLCITGMVLAWQRSDE